MSTVVKQVYLALCFTASSFVGNQNKIFGMLRLLRLFKVLKPLRVIHRAPGLKLVVQSLLISLKPIGNIVLICCTFFLIFGILGVQVIKISKRQITIISNLLVVQGNVSLL